jgi:hypothetical protein
MTKGQRMPAEVTAPSYNSADIQNSKEKTFYLYPSLEIPQGSYFKRQDLNIYNDKCKIAQKKSEKKGSILEELYVDIGMYSGVDYSHAEIGIYSIPTRDADTDCGSGCFKVESEYMSSPYNMKQVTKIYIDPNAQTVSKIETEFRRGPKGMKFEKMALQMKYTCSPEFLGM